MTRKRITQAFPFLLPLRVRQKTACFYLKMRFDGNTYAVKQTSARLPFPIFSAQTALINRRSGFPLEYQYNKVENLKIAVEAIDGLVIQPGETFSFWQLVRRAARKQEYKDALTLSDQTLTAVRGGGLCQLSGLLFWLFLHTPLSVIERHPHSVEALPSPPGEIPHGVDAAIYEGWLDLKVTNRTSASFQLAFRFDDAFLYAHVYSSAAPNFRYEVYDDNLAYEITPGARYRQNDIRRKKIDILTGQTLEDQLLYRSRCRLDYPPVSDEGEAQISPGA